MRIIKVKGCFDCPYRQNNRYCGKVLKTGIKQIPDINVFPEWCPLEDNSYELFGEQA